MLKLRLCTVNDKAKVRKHDTFKDLHTFILNSLYMKAVDVNIFTFKSFEINIMKTLKKDTVFKTLVLKLIMYVKVISHRCYF